MAAMEAYKLLMLVPALTLLLSLGYIYYLATGPGFLLDIDLRGGTQISFGIEGHPDIAHIEALLEEYEPNVRTARSLTGYTVIVEVSPETNVTAVLNVLKSAYHIEDYSVQSVGPALSAAFFRQAQIAMLIAFIFMAIVVFIIFRIPTPCFYVILSAFADIVEAFAASQFLGIRLSLATFAALLLLIGYSVDTDILLTTRLLKTEGELKFKLKRAMKTGLTMMCSTGAALLALFVMSSSTIITQIASVLLIGLLFDIMNTWITNAGLLRWYLEKKVSR